ncbi:MAG TPA: tRNA 2-selenouridine(34) synthase MnmH [Puia sp.]
MTRHLTIDQVLTGPPVPIVDVRTPAEFAHGHTPGAVNIPLFTNEERVVVGTAYKQQGREAAILLGFDLTGSKWSGFIRRALEIAPEKKLAVHCWRGGMRSAAMAWALDLYGFEVSTIQGGYKQYRRWVLKKMEQPWELRVVGGMTGTGKTEILKRLDKEGEQTIDLEDLAKHQGSTYGTLNRLIQPTQEQFENDLAARLAALDPARPIWIEDESQSIGKRILPKPFWRQMQEAPLFDLEVPIDQRVTALEAEYGSLVRDFLVECTERIIKRLGSEHAKQAIIAIREDRIPDFIRQVLVYYDKAYRKGLKPRDKTRIIPLPLENRDPLQNAKTLLGAARSLTTTTNDIAWK